MHVPYGMLTLLKGGNKSKVNLVEGSIFEKRVPKQDHLVVDGLGPSATVSLIPRQ